MKTLKRSVNKAENDTEEMASDPESQASRPVTPTTSTKKRKTDLVEYLTEKSENDRALRREELKMEEQKL